MQRKINQSTQEQRLTPFDREKQSYLTTLRMVPKSSSITLFVNHFFDTPTYNTYFSDLDAVLRIIQPKEIVLEGWQAAMEGIVYANNNNFEAEFINYLSSLLERIYRFRLYVFVDPSQPAKEIQPKITLNTRFLSTEWAGFFIRLCDSITRVRGPLQVPTPAISQSQLQATASTPSQKQAPKPSQAGTTVVTRGAKRALASQSQSIGLSAASEYERPAKKPRIESSTPSAVIREGRIYDMLDSMVRTPSEFIEQPTPSEPVRSSPSIQTSFPPVIYDPNTDKLIDQMPLHSFSLPVLEEISEPAKPLLPAFDEGDDFALLPEFSLFRSQIFGVDLDELNPQFSPKK